MPCGGRFGSVRVGYGGKYGCMITALSFMARGATCVSEGMAVWREMGDAHKAWRPCKEGGGEVVPVNT